MKYKPNIVRLAVDEEIRSSDAAPATTQNPLKMMKTGREPLSWGASYQTCLNECIQEAIVEGNAEIAAIYRDLPIPSDQEWAECLQEVAEEPSEDLGNPYHCMGRYEFRLDKRGIPTALSILVARVDDDIVAMGLQAGIHPDFLDDAKKLFFLSFPNASPHDKKNDS